MTQEEKDLLLKDLSARLPYGVKITNGLNIITLKVRIDTAPATLAQFIHSEHLKYYLRPMSSMTEEEFQELHSICPHSTFNKTNVSGWIIGIDGSEYGRISRIDEISKLIDWLNAHHFDYRGLIEKGLALEAPEGMYEI